MGLQRQCSASKDSPVSLLNRIDLDEILESVVVEYVSKNGWWLSAALGSVSPINRASASDVAEAEFFLDERGAETGRDIERALKSINSLLINSYKY